MLLHAHPDAWIWFVLASLATWRIATFLCFEDGPFNMMVSARRVGYRIGVGRLLECFHCTALWTSIVLVAVVYSLSLASILLAFAAAGAASLLERIAPADQGTEIDG